MTRNNLKEHLSWLLNSRASVPPTTCSLPPANISFSSISNTQSETSYDVPDEAVHESREISAPNLFASTDEGDTEEMARTRIAPGSPSKPTRTIEKPANFKANVANGPMFKAPQVSDLLVSTSTSASQRQFDVNPKSEISGSDDDIEVMDLSEAIRFAEHSPLKRIVPPINGRKRKSEELEPASLNRRSSPKVEHQSERESQGYAVIEESEDESSIKSKEVPSDPPPPYSTNPFGARIPTRPTLITSSQSIDQDRPVGLDPEAAFDNGDDDDIMNFAEPQTNGYKASNDPPLAASRKAPQYRVEKPDTAAVGSAFGAKTDEKKTLEASQIMPSHSSSEPSVTEISQDDALILKNLFSSSESTMKEAIDALDVNRDRVCFELTEGLDEDQDVRHLEVELDELDIRAEALKSLWNKRALYRTLSDEKDRLKDALLQAVRARHGVDAAKSSNLAGKEKLRKLESECLAMLNSCRQDVTSFVGQSTLESVPESTRNVAVKSSQQISKQSDLQSSSAPSSSRIAQTQYQALMPPPPPPRSRTLNQPLHREAFDDDYGFSVDNQTSYDDLDQPDSSHARSRKQQAFSSRMGTPPTVHDDEEEEEFGLNDDDDMLEWAQDMENGSSQSRLMSQNAKRSPLTETSGNAQIRYHATSVKASKSKGTQLDDLEKRHFIHPWSDDVKSTLKQRFKLKGFRQGQVETINATLAGKDVFVLMPTGGGKSLCYQLPSLITSGKTRGVTIVVSPLMSLMEDQVRHLTALGIQAFLFNSETSRDERNALLSGLQDHNVEKFIQVLYVTPELLSVNQRMLSALEVLHRNKRMARLVIDEAHCVSQWGHDFRPDYKALGEVRRRFPEVPVMALTATATENVKYDTIHNLGIEGCEIFSRSFNRPNLYYGIRAKGKSKECIESIAALIKEKYSRQCGIIYCFSRNNCQDVATALRTNHQIKAHHYHAGMEAAEKSRVQQEWQAGNVHVIVATIAFGMGIDKPNVRFVIHHSLPKSLEGYYQETGRAGRDGKRSDCYLYFGYQDASKLRRMIDDDDAPWEQKERQRLMLRTMVQFCDNESDCRRVQILAYFNEKFRKEDCKDLCDNCNSGSTFEEVDFTEHACRAINVVRHLQSEKVTIPHCIEVYRGADTKKIRDCGHNSLDDYGGGKRLDKGDITRLFYRLISEGAIREVQVFNKAKFAQQYVQLGETSNKFSSGKLTLKLQIKSSTGVRSSKSAAKQQNNSKVLEDNVRGRNVRNTGISSSSRDLPASTNVSSPIQPVRKALNATRQSRLAKVQGKANSLNQFILSDSEDGDYQNAETESEDEAFEPAPEPFPRRRRAAAELGPPITNDSFMDDLNDIHRLIVDQFVRKASELCKTIMTKKNLQMAPFSDTILRQMAARFTETEEAMLTIPGIDPRRVEAHGHVFGKLVKQSHRQYDELVASEDRSNDKHAQNVIDLVSDEEEEEEQEVDDDMEDFGSLDEDFDDEAGPMSTSSSYFTQQDNDVAAFNANFKNSQSVGMRTIAASQPLKAPKARRKTKYSVKPRNSSGSGQSYARQNPSKDFDKFRFNTGSVNKKRKATAGSSSRGTARSTTKTTKKASGFSIPTMPT